MLITTDVNDDEYIVTMDSARLDEKFGCVPEGSPHHVEISTLRISPDTSRRSAMACCSCGAAGEAAALGEAQTYEHLFILSIMAIGCPIQFRAGSLLGANLIPDDVSSLV